jgi:hypothetical protein
MSYVQDKTKTGIMNGLASTVRADSQIHNQKKVRVIVNSTEDIQIPIEKQNNTILTLHLSNSVQKSIAQILFQKSSKSLDKVALSPNGLTGAIFCCYHSSCNIVF